MIAELIVKHEVHVARNNKDLVKDCLIKVMYLIVRTCKIYDIIDKGKREWSSSTPLSPSVSAPGMKHLMLQLLFVHSVTNMQQIIT